jgi:protein-tyrosine-phosphatase/nucleoside 2-deoxyribosyltransferase
MESNPILEKYPNPRANAFLMMRFADTDQHKEILSALVSSLSNYGIHPLRADMHSYATELWANVRAYMDACGLGVAVFEQIDEQDFNPNISIELGYMIGREKKVLLLKEKTLASLPTDITGHLYKEFDSSKIGETVQKSVLEWLRDTGIAKSAGERSVLFVSHGGTCRCAMAKVVLRQALAGRRLPFPLRIESVAHSYGDHNFASRAARRVISEAYGADYLQDHRVTRRNPGILDDADLILVMEDSLRVGLPQDKTFLFNEFFGIQGPVVDPWPDHGDDATLARYRECLSHLRSLLEPNVTTLLKRLATETVVPANTGPQADG